MPPGTVKSRLSRARTTLGRAPPNPDGRAAVSDLKHLLSEYVRANTPDEQPPPLAALTDPRRRRRPAARMLAVAAAAVLIGVAGTGAVITPAMRGRP